jgi:hypothetical protein
MDKFSLRVIELGQSLAFACQEDIAYNGVTKSSPKKWIGGFEPASSE